MEEEIKWQKKINSLYKEVKMLGYEKKKKRKKRDNKQKE